MCDPGGGSRQRTARKGGSLMGRDRVPRTAPAQGWMSSESTLCGEKERLIPNSREVTWIGLTCSLLGAACGGETLGQGVRTCLREDCTKFCVAALRGLCKGSIPRWSGGRNPRERLLSFPFVSRNLSGFHCWFWQYGICGRGRDCRYRHDPEQLATGQCFRDIESLGKPPDSRVTVTGSAQSRVVPLLSVWDRGEYFPGQ